MRAPVMTPGLAGAPPPPSAVTGALSALGATANPEQYQPTQPKAVQRVRHEFPESWIWMEVSGYTYIPISYSPEKCDQLHIITFIQLAKILFTLLIICKVIQKDG